MSRLQLPPVHARTVTAWGKKRTAPPEGSDARRLWDEVLGHLTIVLRAKGIVQSPGPTVFELMDIPLDYLASRDQPPPAALDADEDFGAPDLVGRRGVSGPYRQNQGSPANAGRCGMR